MRIPAFLGGGLGGLQNAGAWALAAAAAFAWQRHSAGGALGGNGAEMTAAERDAFNAARKKATEGKAAEIKEEAAVAAAAATAARKA